MGGLIVWVFVHEAKSAAREFHFGCYPEIPETRLSDYPPMILWFMLLLRCLSQEGNREDSQDCSGY